MNANVLPERVGRFNVERSLGQGGQGVVLLGVDPDLDRKVAIKLMRPSALHVDAAALMAEARIVSRLAHPNLVTLFEVGNHHGLPYLVSEFVQGQTLGEMIEQAGGLALDKAVDLMAQLLDGMAYAHEQGVGHFDLNPSNILVVSDKTMKVLDFGLACESAHQDGAIRGTLRYMSPQRLEAEKPQAACDVFALGAIFVEMLTGKVVFDGCSAGAVIAQIINDEGARVVAAMGDLPDPVRAIIGCALHINADQRYASAAPMREALAEYVENNKRGVADAVAPAAQSHASVQFLLRKMTYQKGFTALAQSLDEIRKATSSDSNASAKQLSNIIAKDVSLMQRVLATANSAAYGAREITTITDAVVLMGLEQVRMCVTNALLEANFAEGSVALRNALTESFLTGLLASCFARHTRACRAENAFVAGNFHAIGRTLTIHYFPDEFTAIRGHPASDNGNEGVAARDILGVTYDVIGQEVGRTWKLPEAIVAAMAPLPPGEISAPQSPDDALWLHALFADAVVCQVLAQPPESLDEALGVLTVRLAPGVSVTTEQLRTGLDAAAQMTDKYARLMQIPAGECPVTDKLTAWREVDCGVAATA